MGNNNSAIPKAQGGQVAKVASTESEPQYVPMQRRPSRKAAEKVGLGVYHTEPHGKKPLDDDTFSNYIQRAKYKIRSLSNIGRREEQRNPVPDVPNVINHNNNNNNNKEEDERDQFSDFIQNARKKLRTVTSIGKGNSFKKG